MSLESHPHNRYNPLLREWLLVSPERSERPWQGQREKATAKATAAYAEDCPLCPGNTRASGIRNPSYAAPFVFDNDFAACLPDTADGAVNERGLIVARAERGICRVVCFSPRHDLTLSTLEASEVRRVVDVWAGQYAELGSQSFIRYVQIFENRGEMMGCSNPHPHGQIWATSSIPNEPAKEQAAQRAYADERGACLLCDYLDLERARPERLVAENDSFSALVPYWAVWPFETLIVSRRHATSLDALTPAERQDLATLLKRLTTRYDNLFEVSFPYSMGFHQRPTDAEAHDEWHLHAHFYPPLLRSATVKKFMVGFELLGMPQRDISAEAAAARLRELSERHYRERA
jgi:UDPglucose--hexose-1-phosphate uridylyltransferase